MDGDRVRAALTDDYQHVFLDVHEDGQLVAQPLLTLEQAQETAVDILNCLVVARRRQKETNLEPKPKLEVVP